VRVDAHQHFWSLARNDYGWLSEAVEPLYRDFQPDDLAPLLKTFGIEATVLVQAAATEAETRYLFELARQGGFVRGVVGWLDLLDENVPERATSLAAEGRGLLKGLRPMLQDIPADDWIADPRLDPAFDVIRSLGLALDALVRPRHLPHLAERIRRSPGVRMVIDHAAKPDIAGRQYKAWRAALEPFALMPGVYCKLSGLVTEAGPHWRRDDVTLYGQAVLDMFGPERTLWGSDWPVLNLASDYAAWFALTENVLADLPGADQDLVLGGNAVRFYSLETGVVA
jgi:L-fuconolactonase